MSNSWGEFPKVNKDGTVSASNLIKVLKNLSFRWDEAALHGNAAPEDITHELKYIQDKLEQELWHVQLG